MKTLSTAQQTELREFLEAIKSDTQGDPFDGGLQSQLTYWIIELQPKRVRRNKTSETIMDEVVQ